MCLENILIEYFDLKEDYEEVEWYNAYGKLTQLIEDLQQLGVLNNASKIIDCLDEIDNEII